MRFEIGEQDYFQINEKRRNIEFISFVKYWQRFRQRKLVFTCYFLYATRMHYKSIHQHDTNLVFNDELEFVLVFDIKVLHF